jgi:DNA repair protein RecO (recombination protein O)
MLVKTKGFALSYIRYSEKDIITKIYTEELGLQSYLVRGVLKQKSKIKIYAFEPFTLLELDVYHKENKHLNYIKELKIIDSQQIISNDIVKKSICILLSEFFIKSVKEEEPNKVLFEFVENAFKYYLSEKKYPEFHLQFLACFTQHLGIIPSNDFDESVNKYFDIKEGQFISRKPILHNLFLELPASKYFSNYLDLGIENKTILSNSVQRKQMLNYFILYYQNHIDGFSDLKSLEILSEVLE